jgi:hypothetical protein
MNSSLSNFKHNAEKIQGKNSFSAFLLLAESSQYNWFSRLQAHAQHDYSQVKSELGDWKISLTGNEGTLRAVNKNGEGFFIAAGRQIVTREHLEILALLTTEQFKDGEPMESVLENILSKDAIPIIPWGVGKWIGKRGTFLKHFLTHAAPSILYLGDTGSRPSFWGTPYLFKIAAKNGIRVLAGADPLPIVSDVCRPGSYGSVIFAKLNEKSPSAHLKQLLKDSKKITIAAVTLGIQLDKEIKKFTYTDMSKAVIYDACASAIIEEKCDELENKIINNFPEHYLTNRFSPGYGDLELNNQKNIINLLQTEKKLGLTLTSGNLMIPQKSVTFIVGITEVEKCTSKNKCDRCNAKCEFRVKTRK